MKRPDSKWLNKALEDLENAKILLGHKDASLNIIGFLCQQSVEKSLKGFLNYHKVYFSKTHNLLHLIELCMNIEAGFQQFKENVGLLQPFAVEARYADFFITTEETRAEIMTLLQTTEDIFEFVQVRIER